VYHSYNCINLHARAIVPPYQNVVYHILVQCRGYAKRLCRSCTSPISLTWYILVYKRPWIKNRTDRYIHIQARFYSQFSVLQNIFRGCFRLNFVDIRHGDTTALVCVVITKPGGKELSHLRKGQLIWKNYLSRPSFPPGL
jgi:hypothetical protein